MALYTHEIPGGAAWSVTLKAGRSLTLTTTGAGANVSTLVFAADRLDRMNVPDTLKAQMTARVRPPVVLMSDRGLALASVVDSSVPWHDALCGFTGPRDLERLSPTDYQHDRNEWRRSARELFLLELFKYGMGEADLHGTVNFFSKVVPADDASCSLTFVPQASVAGDHVTLRAEQELLVILATTAHPLDPSVRCAPAGVVASVDLAAPWDGADPSATFRPESFRALDQTRKAFA
ncbi:hypothetical protein SAMN04515671_2107 [Nakamurella panacisegetis]|uniref:DUF1989 domain-containing protein n=1 Tax=Nakamurella panacisegetis TaxID=1090615 RepID=A0A1H0MUU3_9ACTN|nr:DUF1989 domain-containing protein [Nakamurella panacisegetis]SDO84177.1 hypothetical protein SAMN04515671_2107 [Nakamurella panacisegetis]